MSPYPWISEKPDGSFFSQFDETHAPDRSAAAGTSGRGGDGRFAKGNKGGPGNPFNRQVAAIRRALLDAVTPEEIHYLARRLMDKALEGNLAAAKLLLSYLVGKPAPAADPDTLDQQEWQQTCQSAVPAEALSTLMTALPPAAANAIVRMAWPAVASALLPALVQSLKDADAFGPGVATPPMEEPTINPATNAVSRTDPILARPPQDEPAPETPQPANGRRPNRPRDPDQPPLANGSKRRPPRSAPPRNDDRLDLPAPLPKEPTEAASDQWDQLQSLLEKRAGFGPQAPPSPNGITRGLCSGSDELD